MSFTDRAIRCVECGNDFTFTASEQELFASRGYNNDPKRCPSCREAKRSQRYGFRSSSSVDTYRSPRREMYPAVCASCGQETQVPFQPREGRPVYCNSCYVKTAPRR
ncbi:MAG: zinc-ribbon domain containing protein [Chloroflexi bacterium]|nr:zinc-ribbon domain containing protein [Chloroflexota bacterium]